MQDAVIVDCVRTAVGKAGRGALKNTAAGRSHRVCHPPVCSGDIRKCPPAKLTM